VIAGPLGWQTEVDVEKIQEERFLSYRMEEGKIFADRRIRRLSYVPFQQLVSLIRGARAVLFPSLYEGFGLPVLEAMLLGTPVMTSDVSSLPEVAGDAALMVDPIDLDGMAASIRTLDQDKDLRAELSVRGRERAKLFSPEAYQKRLVDLYGRFVGATHQSLQPDEAPVPHPL
jgi:glycosyltransferase involved in cell wall biosynthesis